MLVLVVVDEMEMVVCVACPESYDVLFVVVLELLLVVLVLDTVNVTCDPWQKQMLTLFYKAVFQSHVAPQFHLFGLTQFGLLGCTGSEPSPGPRR